MTFKWKQNIQANKHKLQNWVAVQFGISQDSLVKCLVIGFIWYKKSAFFWGHGKWQHVLINIGKFNFTLILLMWSCAYQLMRTVGVPLSGQISILFFTDTHLKIGCLASIGWWNGTIFYRIILCVHLFEMVSCKNNATKKRKFIVTTLYGQLKFEAKCEFWVIAF